MAYFNVSASVLLKSLKTLSPKVRTRVITIIGNIIPIKSNQLNQVATRPSKSTLNSNKIKRILKINHPEMDYIINIFKGRINE